MIKLTVVFLLGVGGGFVLATVAVTWPNAQALAEYCGGTWGYVGTLKPGQAVIVPYVSGKVQIGHPWNDPPRQHDH